MKLIICTTHGKPFRRAGFVFDPREREYDLTEEQLAEVRGAAKPKAFRGTDGTVHGGKGVLRIRTGTLAAEEAGEDEKPPASKQDAAKGGKAK